MILSKEIYHILSFYDLITKRENFRNNFWSNFLIIPLNQLFQSDWISCHFQYHFASSKKTILKPKSIRMIWIFLVFNFPLPFHLQQKISLGLFWWCDLRIGCSRDVHDIQNKKGCAFFVKIKFTFYKS